MKNKIKFLGIIAIIAAVLFAAACEGDETDNDGDGTNGDGSLGGGKSDWLWSNEKIYTITDGVAVGVSYNYDVEWIRYTDNKNFERRYSYTQPMNTQQTNETYTYSQSGSTQVTVTDTRNGNTQQYTTTSSANYTITIDYVNPSIQGSVTTVSGNSTTTQTTTYDAESGLNLSFSYSSQSSGTSNGTPSNSSSSQLTNYSVNFVNDVDGAKTYRVTISSMTTNGNTVDLSTIQQSYTEYTIKNGIIMEQKSYKADNTLLGIQTYSFPSDQTIRSRLPTYTVYTVTSYNSNGTTTTSNSTCELLSSSSTEMVIRYKYYSNGVLSSQTDETYKKR